MYTLTVHVYTGYMRSGFESVNYSKGQVMVSSAIRLKRKRAVKMTCGSGTVCSSRRATMTLEAVLSDVKRSQVARCAVTAVFIT